MTIVVGYKLEHIIEAFPDASFVYNEQYDQTNTSKSLLRALQASAPGGVLWMNGDVVFDPEALDRAADLRRARPVLRRRSTPPRCPTKRSSTRPTPRASSSELSKTVVGGLGEAVGINYISRDDKAALMRQLNARRRPGLLRARHRARDRAGRLRIEPVDISDLYAVEIDFAEDLERANLFV